MEVNNTFYRLPPTDTFAAWVARTPDEFRFVVKASRYLSHVRRLMDPADPVALLVERAAPLASSGKLGPVLLQLPPTLRAEPQGCRTRLPPSPATACASPLSRDTNRGSTTTCAPCCLRPTLRSS